MRRMLALAGAALAALTFAVAPAANAAIDPGDTRSARAGNSVSVFGNMVVMDDDWWPDHDDYATITYNEVRSVSATQPAAFVEITRCAGGEARGELKVQLQRQANESIHVVVDLYLFEGISCEASDLDASKHLEYDVAPGTSVSKDIKAVSTGTGGGDYAHAKFTVANTQV